MFDFFGKKKKQIQHFSHDKAEYQWESAVETYCEINETDQADIDFDNLDEKTENILWEYAGNHIAYFMVWLIRHDFFVAEDLEEEIKLVKSEKMSGVSFLMDCCDGTFARDMVKDEVVGFVDSYYESPGTYLGDYCDFIEGELKGEVFGTRFLWEEYHQFEGTIDKAYREYCASTS